MLSTPCLRWRVSTECAQLSIYATSTDALCASFEVGGRIRACSEGAGHEEILKTSYHCVSGDQILLTDERKERKERSSSHVLYMNSLC